MASPCGVGPTPWGNLNSFLQNFLCSTAGEIIFLGQFSQVFFYLVFFNYLVFFFLKKKKERTGEDHLLYEQLSLYAFLIGFWRPNSAN
jgi:hypothetical protein